MGDAAIEAFPALPTPHYRTDGGCIVVQKGDAHYQHLGDALLPKLGTHCRTDGGHIITPMGDATPTLWLAFMIGLRIQKWCQNMLV